jgi:hypothetical protein
MEILKKRYTLKSPAVVLYPKVPKYVYHVFKPKTIEGYTSSYIQEQKNNCKFLKIIHWSNNSVTLEKCII